MSEDKYLDQLRSAYHLTEQAIRDAIEALDLSEGSRGLDAGCGIGLDTILLGRKVGAQGRVTGLDISRAFLDYAAENARDSDMGDTLVFREGDVLSLPFKDGEFDWAWSKDCLWSKPDGVKELARVVRPGGTVAVLFWSTQAVLPGYPQLEARLMRAWSDHAPYTRGVVGDRHFMRALGWLRSAGLQDATVSGFSGGAHAPLSAEMRESVHCFLDMFFGELQPHTTEEDWQAVQRLCDPQSPDYVLDNPDYYCLYTYSMFRGTAIPGT